MEFKLISTKGFQEQSKYLDIKTKRIIDNKLDLILENPFRFKALKCSGHRLFRVPLNINSKEVRLIYKIIKPNIIFICLLERKHDYKDLKKYLKNL